MSFKNQITKALICLPKPQWAPAGVIWSISGAILQNTKCVVDEFQYWHIVVPELFNHSPYLLLVSSELLDLNDHMNTDRSILLRAAQAYPESTFIIWDKNRTWESTDTPNPTNLEVWNDLETNDITKKLLAKISHSVD